MGSQDANVECGAPDYVISRTAKYGPVIFGHIEAKDVGKPSDEIEWSDQLKRHLPVLSNLIFTDYLEFRRYVNGEHRHSASLASVAKGGKLAAEKDGPQATSDLMTGFLEQEAQHINDPRALLIAWPGFYIMSKCPFPRPPGGTYDNSPSPCSRLQLSASRYCRLRLSYGSYAATPN